MCFLVFGTSSICFNHSVHSSWHGLHSFVQNLMNHFRSDPSECRLNACFSGRDQAWGQSELLYEALNSWSISLICLHLNRDLGIVWNLEYFIYLRLWWWQVFFFPPAQPFYHWLINPDIFCKKKPPKNSTSCISNVEKKSRAKTLIQPQLAQTQQCTPLRRDNG